MQDMVEVSCKEPVRRMELEDLHTQPWVVEGHRPIEGEVVVGTLEVEYSVDLPIGSVLLRYQQRSIAGVEGRIGRSSPLGVVQTWCGDRRCVSGEVKVE